jgi:hypothetical protein
MCIIGNPDPKRTPGLERGEIGRVPQRYAPRPHAPMPRIHSSAPGGTARGGAPFTERLL